MKQNYYQYIRGLCILMVLLIHTLYKTDSNYINFFNIALRRIINFTVPVFIFLAGYFTKYDNYKTFYSKKIRRLIIPLLVWKIIYAIIELIKRKPNIIGMIKTVLFGGFHLYYIIVLVLLVLITPLLINYINKEKNKIRLYLPLIITLLYNIFITYYYIKTNHNFILYNYHIFGWFSYYYLGLLLNYKKIEINNKHLYIFCIIGLIITIIEGILIYKRLNYYDLATSQITISNYIYSIIVCLIIKRNDNILLKDNIISSFGDLSYGIYLSHILVVSIIKKIVAYLDLNYYINITLIYVLLIITTYFTNTIYYKLQRRFKYGKNSRKKIMYRM